MTEINEWYEEDGYSANLTILEGKFKQIKKNFTAMDRRVQIEIKRDLAIEKFEKELNHTYTEGKKILNKKAWVENHYNKTFIKEVEVVDSWFRESLEKQKEMTLYDVK